MRAYDNKGWVKLLTNNLEIIVKTCHYLTRVGSWDMDMYYLILVV